MTFSLTEATGSDADLETIVAIVNATSPEEPTSIEELRWQDSTYPGGTRFLARADGQPVGAGGGGPDLRATRPSSTACGRRSRSVPAARRQGIGSAILAAVSARGRRRRQVRPPHARIRGASRRDRLPDPPRVHRVRTKQGGRAPPRRHGAAGRRATDGHRHHHAGRTAGPRRRRARGGDRGIRRHPRRRGADRRPATLAEFRARDVDRPQIPHDAFMLAARGRSGTRRRLREPDPDPRPGAPKVLARHDGGGPRLAWSRHRAGAQAGDGPLGDRSTGSTPWRPATTPTTHPMRAVNARLGYRPLPDLLIMRGPLSPVASWTSHDGAEAGADASCLPIPRPTTRSAPSMRGPAAWRRRTSPAVATRTRRSAVARSASTSASWWSWSLVLVLGGFVLGIADRVAPGRRRVTIAGCRALAPSSTRRPGSGPRSGSSKRPAS